MNLNGFALLCRTLHCCTLHCCTLHPCGLTYQFVYQPSLSLLHDDVLGLEVPVYDPPVVQVPEGGHDVVEDLQDLGLPEAPAGLGRVEFPPEVSGLTELHAEGGQLLSPGVQT